MKNSAKCPTCPAVPQRQFTLQQLMIVVALCAVWLIAFRQLPRQTGATTAAVSFIMARVTSVPWVDRLARRGVSEHVVFAVVIASIACYCAGVYSSVVAVGVMFFGM